MRTSPSSRPPAGSKRRSRGFEVTRWIEANCVFTAAEWIGRPFVLQPWQRRLVLELFTVDPAGQRLIRWAYISMAKKNGKTELAAALALYLLIGDGEAAALVVCAAGSDEQADLVFGAAKTMCELSPTLRHITETFDAEILVPSLPGAKLVRVAAAATRTGSTLDGKNIHAVICDELHVWDAAKGEQVWNVLTNGTGARRQPMILQITTAGFDLDSLCGRQYEYAKKVLAGEVVDPQYYALVFEPPESAPHTAPETWALANPSLGVTVHAAGLEDQLKRKTEAVFRRYFCNQWTEGSEVWEVAQLWDDLAAPGLQLDPGLPTCVGVDVGLKHDSSAVLVAQLVGERVLLRARVWENPYPPEHHLHGSWKLDIATVENHLLELYETYPVATREDEEGDLRPGPAFLYDPHFFERSAQDLEGSGLLMIEFPQTDARMVPASQTFFELVKTGVIAHDGSPDLRRHIRNVIAHEKPRGWRISKPKGSKRHIDAAVAAAIAVHELVSHPPEEDEAPTVW
jgi:phage terminase large subunit-like protein